MDDVTQQPEPFQRFSPAPPRPETVETVPEVCKSTLVTYLKIGVNKNKFKHFE
jgi:hypothetical protein